VSAAIIVSYAVVYAVIHSALASQGIKDWTRRLCGRGTDRWYRLAYNAIAGAMLLPLMLLFVWLPDRTLYSFPAPWHWLGLAVQGSAAMGAVYGVWVTDGWHFLGFRQILDSDCPPPCQPPLAVYGLYRWIRHPLYFLGIVFMWSSPTVTLNTAAVFAVFSAYFYVGTFFEERRLMAEHGDAYRQYASQVPRLFPWRGPVRVVLTVPAQAPSRQGTTT
jgi:protein-S-isoprenylcysteine O-methyltransferase Ste14